MVWEFISDGQGNYAGRLISETQKTLDDQPFKIDFVSTKLADMKISEAVIGQHLEGCDLTWKLRQLYKTRHFCDFLVGSISLPNSTSMRPQFGLEATDTWAATLGATASQTVLTESESEFSTVSKLDNSWFDNNSDSAFKTYPTIVITATPHGRIVRRGKSTSSLEIDDAAMSRIIAHLENTYEFQDGADLHSTSNSSSQQPPS